MRRLCLKSVCAARPVPCPRRPVGGSRGGGPLNCPPAAASCASSARAKIAAGEKDSAGKSASRRNLRGRRPRACGVNLPGLVRLEAVSGERTVAGRGADLAVAVVVTVAGVLTGDVTGVLVGCLEAACAGGGGGDAQRDDDGGGDGQ